MSVIPKSIPIIFLSICFVDSYSGCKGQEPFGQNLLVEQKTVSMPGVTGRIDHLDINLKEKIAYVTGLENNSLEIVDIIKGKVLYSIRGLDEPQGVAYIPQQQEIFVAHGGNGDCYFYNALSFKKTGAVHLSSDADDVRYDSADKKIYVGYGEGGIAVIDAMTHLQIAGIKLPAHPEGFQLDKKLNKIFINVPGAHQVIVADLSLFKIISIWNSGEFRANFPLAIDAITHTIFIGFRSPPKLVAMNGNSGAVVARADLVSNADDIFFDEKEGRVYASGGGGFITIYQWQEPAIKQVAAISTRQGARTSLLIPDLKLFILAVRANPGKEAVLKIYKTM